MSRCCCALSSRDLCYMSRKFCVATCHATRCCTRMLTHVNAAVGVQRPGGEPGPGDADVLGLPKGRSCYANHLDDDVCGVSLLPHNPDC